MKTLFSVARVALALVLLGCATGLVGAAGRQAHIRLKFPAGGAARRVVEQAIEGAARRLEQPECQQLFTDFEDTAGNTLLANLIRLRRSAVEYLREVWFVDASETRKCGMNDTIAAFTVPGCRVIHVCGSRFVYPGAQLLGARGEMIIIHELLHSLGLGENPPTSEQITKQVTKRCWR
jgi:hypothetical protein